MKSVCGADGRFRNGYLFVQKGIHQSAFVVKKLTVLPFRYLPWPLTGYAAALPVQSVRRGNPDAPG